MAFKATLKIKNVEYDILSCGFSLNRNIDQKGRPSSGITGGTINLSVEANSSTALLEAMVNEFAPLDGSVTFLKGEEKATMKVLSWTKGYIVDYGESFSGSGSDGNMMISFTVSAQTIKMGNAEHVNDWPAS